MNEGEYQDVSTQSQRPSIDEVNLYCRGRVDSFSHRSTPVEYLWTNSIFTTVVGILEFTIPCHFNFNSIKHLFIQMYVCLCYNVTWKYKNYKHNKYREQQLKCDRVGRRIIYERKRRRERRRPLSILGDYTRTVSKHSHGHHVTVTWDFRSRVQCLHWNSFSISIQYFFIGKAGKRSCIEPNKL
jgi:hypothetical protein